LFGIPHNVLGFIVPFLAPKGKSVYAFWPEVRYDKSKALAKYMEEYSQTPDSNELESLEEPSTTASPSSGSPNAAGSSSNEPSPSPAAPQPPGPPKKRSFRTIASHLNIYLLGFIFLVVIAVAIASIVYFRNNANNASKNNLASQALSTESLKQLANNNVSVGGSKQILTVQSNAIFDGSVLLRGNVDIAGKLVVGDQLSLTGISVSGQSSFQDVKIANDLAVTGDTALQGKLSVQGGLSVNGTTSFNGSLTVNQLTVNSLQLNGQLTLTQHVAAGGGTPSRSNGTALGSGGTSSVSGSDTAGSITINTGSSPAAGCFITVNFATHFNATPHVIVTPVGSAAGGLAYYISRTTSNFSICTNSPAPAFQTFGFDYIAFD
jgi:hypothetical protein